jgi:hypothetical protein
MFRGYMLGILGLLRAQPHCMLDLVDDALRLQTM